jgi:hypothetical protein
MASRSVLITPSPNTKSVQLQVRHLTGNVLVFIVNPLGLLRGAFWGGELHSKSYQAQPCPLLLVVDIRISFPSFLPSFKCIS